MSGKASTERVAIVGGGLAGLAAAVACSQTPLHVELFEARKQLGGRAGSYHDETTGELVDHCQHVSMRCCTNFADFCARTETSRFFERYALLHFFSPAGRRHKFRASSFLPAPFHLAPSLMKLTYLSFGERIAIGRALLKLARTRPSHDMQQMTIGHWLRENRQSESAIRRFWSVVLVSALGESLDKASCAAARKVFLDGFLANRTAYQIEIPTIPLAELYDGHVARWLRARGVDVHVEQLISSVEFQEQQVTGLRMADGSVRRFDYVILAVPWRQLANLVPNDRIEAVAGRNRLAQIDSAPITAVHLWFDRPITELPHAVIVDRLSQWLFNHGHRSGRTQGTADGHAYQVVISASHDLAGRDRNDIRDEVVGDLTSIWPATAAATLIRWQMITQRHAVFSYAPGLDAIRPSATTAIEHLFLAGDWTATGWPATMESAVRSGYLAAQQLLGAAGEPGTFCVGNLPPGRLARLILRC